MSDASFGIGNGQPLCQNIAIRASRSTSGTQPIYTVPATRDFYMCWAEIVLSADAAADSTFADMSATVDGSATAILTLRKQTLTAYANAVVVQFNPPLKVDRNTVVNVASTWTVGAGQVGGAVGGYLA